MTHTPHTHTGNLMKYKSFMLIVVIVLLIVFSLIQTTRIGSLNKEIATNATDYNGLMIAYEDAINADDNAACIATMREVLRAYDYDE